MKCYSQLTLEQRYQIEAGISMRLENSEIAERIGVHRSTVYREVKRNGERHGSWVWYTAKRAEKRAMARRKEKGVNERKIQGALKRLIEAKLSLSWSPEQIAGRLREERDVRISHETIYQHVLRDCRQGGQLRYCLRFGGYKHHRFKKSRYAEISRQRRKSLDKRPQEANERSTIGHWERDLVQSTRNGPCILTVVDRKSRLSLLRWLSRRDQAETERETLQALEPLADVSQTLTNDNGYEFKKPAELERRLGLDVYFTDPSAPWQRGTVENMNGLIRQYFAKRGKFDSGHAWLAPAIEQTLNFRPRKTLGYKTPHEVFYGDKLKLLEGPLSRLGLEYSSQS